MRRRWARAGLLFTGLAVLTGIAECENQTCFDYDDDGNRFEFACTVCSERDDNPCTLDSWRVAPGETCSLEQQPLVDCDDGNECTANECNASLGGVCEAINVPAGAPCTSPPYGSCDGLGACVPVFPEAGSGSTMWAANTTGGFPPDGGGCDVFFEAIGLDAKLDVIITLHVDSDGAGNLTTGWELSVDTPLLGGLSVVMELGSLDINAVVLNATGGPIDSSLTAEAAGQPLGLFFEVAGVPPLLLQTTSTNDNPPGITVGAATVSPTSGAGSAINVNWGGAFRLVLPLGQTVTTLDESTCVFDQQGAGVDFDVVF